MEADPERQKFPNMPSPEEQSKTLANIKTEPESDTESEDWDKEGALAVLADVEEEAKAKRVAQAALNRECEDLCTQLAKARAKFEAERTLSFGISWERIGASVEMTRLRIRSSPSSSSASPTE